MKGEKRERTRRGKEGRKRRSLSFKVTFAVAVSCALLGFLTQTISITFYGITLANQYRELAENTAKQAVESIRHGSEYEDVITDVMAVYESVPEQERERMDRAEYRALYAGIERTRSFNYLRGMLQSFNRYNDVYDLYIVVPDRNTGELIVIVESNEDVAVMPGDHKRVSARFLKSFQEWNGEDDLNLYKREEQVGVTSTVVVPLRDSGEKTVGWLFVDVSLEELNTELLRYSIAVVIAVLVVTTIISWTYSNRMKRTVTEPLNAIATAAQAYVSDRRSGSEERGHFSDLNIHTGDEIENLSATMADMEEDLLEIEKDLTTATAENERISTELELARRIQANSLPNVFPPFPDRTEFDIYACMHPAKEVGGDFYDFFLLDSDHLALVIADVSGKGVPAALFMMISKILVQNFAAVGGSPREILEMVNKQICRNNREKMFVTVWLGILDLKTGCLTAANAGHEYPAMKAPDGSFEVLKDRHGIFVGIKDGIRYTDYELKMEKGSKLFVYTDGVTEAMNGERKLFGVERMIRALREAEDGSPQQILEHVRGAIDRFSWEMEQFDDITMLCLEYHGPEHPVRERVYPAAVESIPEAIAFVEQELEEMGCPRKSRMSVSIAVEEMVGNIVRYSYGPSGGEMTVRLEALADPRGARITFMDSGVIYNPLEAPEPDVTLGAEERPTGGLGIFLARKMMDEISYEHVDGRNILHMVKNF